MALLAATTVGIVRVRNLFAVVVLSSIYSFLMATLLVGLDAVDVAMTEAAVGAGISTVLMLSALHLTRTEEARPVRSPLLALCVSFSVGAVLVWGISGVPAFGDGNAPLHLIGPDYMSRSVPETGIPNVVTSVLASYRGFDTLGEVIVVFTAAIGVLMLLKRSGDPRRPGRAGKK